MRKFTDVSVMINTHIKPKSEGEKELIIKELDRVLTKFYTKPILNKLILRTADTELVKVTMTGDSVEQGKKFGQMHIHFNLSIEHNGAVLLKDGEKAINTVFKQWWDSQFEWSTGCHAAVVLLDSSRTRNYNIKSGAEDDIEVAIGQSD